MKRIRRIKKEIIVVKVVEFYILKHPITGAVFYVGQTICGLSKRLSNHISHPYARVKEFVNPLKEQGLKPIIERVDSCLTTEDWEEKERFYIKKYRDLGFDLANICDGGAGSPGIKRSKESTINGILKRRKTFYSKCIETGEIETHIGLIDIREKLGVSRSVISTGVKRKSNIKGYIFSKDLNFDQSKESLAYKKPVECTYPSGEKMVFESAKKAGEFLGIDASGIRQVAHGKFKQQKGFTFKYI